MALSSFGDTFAANAVLVALVERPDTAASRMPGIAHNHWRQSNEEQVRDDELECGDRSHHDGGAGASRRGGDGVHRAGGEAGRPGARASIPRARGHREAAEG